MMTNIKTEEYSEKNMITLTKQIVYELKRKK